jgi:hypothetical protein
MTKPENLPENLEPLRDAVIDYIYGRLASFPPNLLPLLEWLSDDGLLCAEAKEALALNMYSLRTKCFEDSELADWEGLEEGDITDELRVNFARERMEAAFETDESLVESIQGALLTNEQGEEAYICAVFESHGQGGMEINHWAYVKTFEEFLNRIKENGSLVLLDDIQNQSNEDILKHWKIDGALPNSPEGLKEELIPIRDGAIDFALGRSKSEPENIEKLYEWFEFEGPHLLGYIDWGFDYGSVAGYFFDDELSATLDIDVEKLTDEMRISFAREHLKKEFEEESSITVFQAVISNEKREKALLGILQSEAGQGESGFSHWGIFKTKEDFLKTLEDNEWFISISDEEKITDEYILKSWGKY